MTQATIERLDTRELWQQFSENPLDWYLRAADDLRKRGVEDQPTLTRCLEDASPSEDGELDAFGRMLKEAGIRTKSDPMRGFWASKANEFFERGPANRALYTEFFARQWRKVAYQPDASRAVLLSTDGTPGSWETPYYDAMAARWDQQVAAPIPLSELVAVTTPIEGQDYRAFYLTYSASEQRMVRVGETAEIPIATISGSENTIRLKKFGRGLRASYEELRRMRVDKLSLFIQMAAVQAEKDKVAAAIDVLVNGDGNSNTPTTHDLTTLDSAASAGTLTLKGWLAYKMKFVEPYTITHALLQEAPALQLALLNTGSGNVPLVQANLGGLGTALVPINQFGDGVRYGWTSDAPTLKIIGYDRRFALENVVEIGGEISEMERFITNQTQVMTMTEVQGFAILDSNARLLLDINA